MSGQVAFWSGEVRQASLVVDWRAQASQGVAGEALFPEDVGPDLFRGHVENFGDDMHPMRRHAFPLRDCLVSDAASIGDLRAEAPRI
jgi:hypothetical protein